MNSLPESPDAAPAKEGQEERRDVFAAIALALLAFGVYAATMCRTIYTGDDGDLITAMATGGICHPTGYPLFTLLGRLFLTILAPIFPEPAARINLMTALFGAVSIGFLYRFLVQVLTPERRAVAATGALVFAFAPTLWQQSLSCEVYSLTCLFLAAILDTAALWQKHPGNNRLLQRLTLLYGLALTNHLTIALFFPGFLVWVLVTRPTLWREGKLLLSLVGLFVTPLLSYLYLPIAAHGNAPIRWGDPSTLWGFWTHITGREYRDGSILPAALLLLHAKRYALELLPGEFGGVLLCLAPVGIVCLARRNFSFCLLLLSILLANLAFAFNYNILDIYVYFIPSYLVMTIFMTLGAASLLDLIVSRLRLTDEARRHYAPLLTLVLLAACTIHVSQHWAETDKSGNYLEADFSANVLRSAPPHALVISYSNDVFTLWYREWVRHERPDVVHVNWAMMEGMAFYGAWYYHEIARFYPPLEEDMKGHLVPEQVLQDDDLLRVVRNAIHRGTPVLLVADDLRAFRRPMPGFPSLDELLATQFVRVPWGIGERLYLKGEPLPEAKALVAENERIWGTFTTRGLYTGWAFNDSLQFHIPQRYARAQVALGQWEEKAGRWDLAAYRYTQASRLFHIPAADEGRARCAQALSRSPQ